MSLHLSHQVGLRERRQQGGGCRLTPGSRWLIHATRCSRRVSSQPLAPGSQAGHQNEAGLGLKGAWNVTSAPWDRWDPWDIGCDLPHTDLFPAAVCPLGSPQAASQSQAGISCFGLPVWPRSPCGLGRKQSFCPKRLQDKRNQHTAEGEAQGRPPWPEVLEPEELAYSCLPFW